MIKDLHLQTRSNPNTTLAVTTNLLHKDSNGPDMSPDFHYHSIIGKLNFLEKSTQPDISVSVHQCAHFSKSPKKSHTEAVKCIGQYLLASQDKGLIIHPNKQWHFDCWVDADFAGNWRQADAHIDPMTSKSHSGWIVHFAGAPHYLGVQNANHHGNVHHRGGIHSPIHQFKGGHPHDGDPQRSKRAGAAGRLPASQSPLHCV